MTEDFVKFPRTPHIAILDGEDRRGDKVMSANEREVFFDHEIIVEEKIDGANLGISFDCQANIRVQNRGAYLHLPYGGQWRRLTDWLIPRRHVLRDHLTNRYVLFGEWCYAQHSIFYDGLTDWFLGFDVYDREACRFLSCSRRNEMFAETGIHKVPAIASGRFTLQTLSGLLSISKLADHPAEGLYLRLDDNDWLIQRAKLVRPSFSQSILKHWSRSRLKPNRLKAEPTI